MTSIRLGPQWISTMRSVDAGRRPNHDYRIEAVAGGRYIRRAILPSITARNRVDWHPAAKLRGIADLPRFLRLLRTDPGFGTTVTSLGIARDAETSTSSAFQSVCSALGGAGLAQPQKLLTPVAGPPTVAVFLFPDCTGPGMLEDLCLQAVVADLAVKCVDEYFDCLQKQGIPAPSPLAKARLQAFLASRTKPGLLLGQAAVAKHFPWQHPAFDLLKQFLHAL
jgi:hypothetical protein